MVDPARPAAGQLSPEPLGLSRSVEWIPNDRFDESEHAKRQPAVDSRPVFEVLEVMTVETVGLQSDASAGSVSNGETPGTASDWL